MSKFIHRRADNSIAVIMETLLPGYSLTPTSGELQVESVADTDPALVAEIASRQPPAVTADNIDKVMRAVLLASASMAAKTPAQAKAAFLTAWGALP